MSAENISVLLKLRGAPEFKHNADAAGRSVKGITAQTKRLGTESVKTDRAVSRHRKGIGLLGHSARGAALGLGGLVGGLVAVGQAKRAISTTGDLAKAQIGLARNLGLSNQQAGQWAAIAHVRGIDNRALNMSFTTLGRNMGKAIAGGKTQTETFRTLGISTGFLKKHHGDFNAVLMKTADGLGNLKGGGDRAAATQALLGRGAQKLLPLFKEGSKSWKEQAALANKYGAVIGGKPLKTQGDLIRAQHELEYAQLGMQVQFSTQIAPKLIKGFNLILKAGNRLRPAFAWMSHHATFSKLIAGAVLATAAIRKIPGGTWLAKKLLSGLGGLGAKLFARLVGPETAAATTAGRTAGIAGGTAMTAGVALGIAGIGVVITDRLNKVRTDIIDPWIKDHIPGGSALNAVTNFVGKNADKIPGVGGQFTSQIFGKGKGKKKARGGPILGSGRGDHVPLLAEPGEFMIRRDAARRFGVPALTALNAGNVQGFASRVPNEGRANITMPDRVPVDLGATVGAAVASAVSNATIQNHLNLKIGERDVGIAVASVVDRQHQRR